jgi:hypothetical protein
VRGGNAENFFMCWDVGGFHVRVRVERGGSGGCGIFFGFFRNGFVWDFFSLGFEAVEVFDGSAVLAVGLGLIAEEEGEGAAVAGHQVEAFG